MKRSLTKIFIPSFISLVIISACGVTVNNLRDNSETDSGTSSSLQIAHTAVSDTSALWNQEKAADLSSFMVSFGAQANVLYYEYNQQKNVDFYGLSLPESVLGASSEWKMVLDETPVVVNWSDDGTSAAGYNLVAVFSDAETQTYSNRRVYFFTFYDSTPQIFVTAQESTNEEQYLYFKETTNDSLKTGFAAIIDGTYDTE